jgi:hypothetical protein
LNFLTFFYGGSERNPLLGEAMKEARQNLGHEIVDFFQAGEACSQRMLKNGRPILTAKDLPILAQIKALKRPF